MQTQFTVIEILLPATAAFPRSHYSKRVDSAGGSWSLAGGSFTPRSVQVPVSESELASDIVDAFGSGVTTVMLHPQDGKSKQGMIKQGGLKSFLEKHLTTDPTRDTNE